MRSRPSRLRLDDRGAQLLNRAFKVGLFSDQRIEARLRFLGFFVGAQIDAAEIFPFAPITFELGFGRFQARQLVAFFASGLGESILRRTAEHIVNLPGNLVAALCGGFRLGFKARSQFTGLS